MKNGTTISIYIPNDLAQQVDELARELRLSRSAALTMIIAAYLKKGE